MRRYGTRQFAYWLASYVADLHTWLITYALKDNSEDGNL